MFPVRHIETKMIGNALKKIVLSDDVLPLEYGTQRVY
jgi:hypothetical protein